MSDAPEAPKFNLNISNLGFENQEQFEQALVGGKGFQPGNYDLEITAAAHHKNKETGSIYLAKDPTWFNVQVSFVGAEERTCKYWVQVPTTKLKFGDKGSMFQARKLVEFMAAIGKPCALADLPTAVPKLFSDPSKLVGCKCNVDIDYEGDHAKKEGDGFVIMRGGKPVVDAADNPIPFPDLDACKAYAQGEKITLRYPAIVKFNPGAAPKKASDDKW